MRVRSLKPLASSFEVRLLDVHLSEDATIKGAFRVESFTDLGIADAEHRAPWIHRGLFDSHLHVTWLGEIERRVIAGHFDDVESYVAALKAELKRIPENETLISYGFDEDRWDLKKDDLLERVGAMLDPSRKWLLYRICGHLACASAGLLSSLGVSSAATLLDDTGIQTLHARMPATSREILKKDFLRAQKKLLESGIDTVGDMSLDEALVPAVIELRDEGHLELEYQGVMLDDTSRGYLKDPVFSNGTKPFEIRHWKRYLDGSFGSRTAWLRSPYADDASTVGLQLHETEELISSARAALARGFALSFHAIGDAALEQLLDMSDALKDEMGAMNRKAGRPLHRIEHAQLMGDDQLERLKKLGLWILCIQPYHREADRSFIRRRLGATRFDREAYRLFSLVDAGLPVSLGSDAPITFFEPAKTLEASDSIAEADALWKFSEGGRVIHGFPLRKLEVGTRVWILEPRTTL
ncbi:MAG: amidohydrolase family protein [Bdellovibrionota bacterium]